MPHRRTGSGSEEGTPSDSQVANCSSPRWSKVGNYLSKSVDLEHFLLKDASVVIMANRGQYEDDVMEDADEAQPQRVRSQVIPRKQKGRGFRERMDTDGDRNGRYESLESGTGPGPAKCKLLI